jgi:inhibitor of KinA sporulation pathway (predicted exonuclease)
MSGLGAEKVMAELESEFTKNFRKKIDEYYKKSIEDFQKNVTEYGLRESITSINWGDWETEKMLAKAVKEKLTEDGYYVTIHRGHYITIHLDRPKTNVSLWKRFINKFK